jgi:hypothetical protein
MKKALTTDITTPTGKPTLILGNSTYMTRVREPGEALPRDNDKMKSVYKPPVWTTRTGR